MIMPVDFLLQKRVMLSCYDYIEAFKRVMDSASKVQMVYICLQYPGYLRFAKWMERLAQGVAEGWNALSKETQQALNSVASWLNDSGEWVYRQGSEAWVWASKTGKSVKSWTNAQIKAAWTEIQHATDMTLEMLKQVDWVQVLTNVAKTVGVILIAVGIGVLVVTLGIPEAIIGAFLLIVRLAISAWGKLAAILGTGTAALAAG